MSETTGLGRVQGLDQNGFDSGNAQVLRSCRDEEARCWAPFLEVLVATSCTSKSLPELVVLVWV